MNITRYRTLRALALFGAIATGLTGCATSQVSRISVPAQLAVGDSLNLVTTRTTRILQGDRVTFDETGTAAERYDVVSTHGYGYHVKLTPLETKVGRQHAGQLRQTNRLFGGFIGEPVSILTESNGAPQSVLGWRPLLMQIGMRAQMLLPQGTSSEVRDAMQRLIDAYTQLDESQAAIMIAEPLAYWAIPRGFELEIGVPVTPAQNRLYDSTQAAVIPDTTVTLRSVIDGIAVIESQQSVPAHSISTVLPVDVSALLDLGEIDAPFDATNLSMHIRGRYEVDLADGWTRKIDVVSNITFDGQLTATQTTTIVATRVD